MRVRVRPRNVWPSALVRESAIISSVGQYISWTDPFSMIHRMKWKWISMCFVLGWYWWSLVRAITDWLSEKRGVGSRVVSKNCEITDRSQSASFEAWVTATYSDSVVDSEIISCRLAAQEMAPPCNRKAYPDIVCLSSATSANSGKFHSNVY